MDAAAPTGPFEAGGDWLGGVLGSRAGAVVGGVGGAVVDGGEGAAVGTLIGPEGTIVGGVAGVGIGATTSGIAGAVTGRKVGSRVGRAVGKWLDRHLKNADQSLCSGSCAANEKVDDLEKRANVKQVTKGKTKHGSLPGADADKEFDKLDPQKVRDIDTQYGPGRVGDLGDGNTVVVRPGNSGDPTEPSLDIQRPNGRNTEVSFPQ